MARYAIIQLCRHGDIVSVLPIAKHLSDVGHEVTMVTHVQFASILEACSYVRVLPYQGLHRSVAGAIREAKMHGFNDGEIIATQVDGNEALPSMDAGNFILQQWVRAGHLNKFHELPLVFDRRDRVAEDRACYQFIPVDDGRPLLAFNFEGHSSRYLQAEAQTKWVNETFGQNWRLLDLGKIKLDKPQHLLGLIEKADCLLTIDTLTLHLAYATMTPTIAMSVEATWYQSEPRKHWLYRCTYPQSVTEKYRGEIKRILDEKDFALGRMIQPMPAPLGDKVIHVADWFLGHEKDNRRILNARKTWDAIAAHDSNYSLVLHEMKEGQRSSKDLGDPKRLPYIHDIIDNGAEGAAGDDIIVWTNSDVCLVPEAIRELRKKLANADCCYSRRIDVQDNAKAMTLADLKTKTTHCGADLFAMRAKFWREYRDEIPLLFLSYEGFDWLMRVWMRNHALNPEMASPVIYHEKHQSYWARPNVILNNPGQLHNRNECEAWARANGCADALYEEQTRYFLFKPDEAWMNKEPVHA